MSTHPALAPPPVVRLANRGRCRSGRQPPAGWLKLRHPCQGSSYSSCRSSASCSASCVICQARNNGGTISDVEQLVAGLFQRPLCWLLRAARCICGRHGIDSASTGAHAVPTHRVGWFAERRPGMLPNRVASTKPWSCRPGPRGAVRTNRGGRPCDGCRPRRLSGKCATWAADRLPIRLWSPRSVAVAVPEALRERSGRCSIPESATTRGSAGPTLGGAP